MHIEVCSQEKIVRVNYESPYVKGLPVNLTIRERIGDAGLQERAIRKTYEDPYMLEMLELYDYVVGNKMSTADARNDIELFLMIMKADEARYKADSNSYI